MIWSSIQGANNISNWVWLELVCLCLNPQPKRLVYTRLYIHTYSTHVLMKGNTFARARSSSVRKSVQQRVKQRWNIKSIVLAVHTVLHTHKCQHTIYRSYPVGRLYDADGKLICNVQFHSIKCTWEVHCNGGGVHVGAIQWRLATVYENNRAAVPVSTASKKVCSLVCCLECAWTKYKSSVVCVHITNYSNTACTQTLWHIIIIIKVHYH